MTNQEVIEILKKNKPTSDPRLCGQELCKAIDKAIEALEKQIPKKPVKSLIGQLYDCPICKSCVGIRMKMFCSYCGQAIDWS